MKNLLLTLAIVFSYSINAQYAVMSAVDLADGGEEDYLALEEFFAEINKEAVKQGLQSGQSVWKRTPKEGDQDSAPEYFIINCGSFSNDLAIAILCCSPPENSFGFLLNDSLIPTNERQLDILFLISISFLCPVALRTNSMFSYTDLSSNNLKS